MAHHSTCYFKIYQFHLSAQICWWKTRGLAGNLNVPGTESLKLIHPTPPPLTHTHRYAKATQRRGRKRGNSESFQRFAQFFFNRIVQTCLWGVARINKSGIAQSRYCTYISCIKAMCIDLGCFNLTSHIFWAHILHGLVV